MADAAIHVQVESNVDRLNATAVHRLLEHLVDRLRSRGEEALRANVPKDTGTMAAHVSSHGPDSAGDVIEAVVGIPPIEIENRRFQTGLKDMFAPGEQSSAYYPEFVRRGTGIFGPIHTMIHARRARVMRWDEPDGAVFRYETKGQPAQDFLLETFEELSHAILPAEVEEFRARVRALSTDPIVI